MGVYVKGMEMPKNCAKCFVGFCKQIGCEHYIGFDDYDRARHPDCPLIEVTEPHGRLGDLDKLEKMFAEIDSAPYSCFDGAEPFYSAEDAVHIIRLAPTVIDAEGNAE